MIRRRRSRIPAWFAAEAHPRRRVLREFAELRTRDRSQRHWPIDPEFVDLPQLRQALREVFFGTCAYCGRAADPGEVTRHRPPEEALDLDRGASPDHYWWLAYEWPNLLLACIDCIKAKGNSFPVAAKRAPAESRGAELDVEQPLLLDPYRDHPERVMTYDDAGFVSGTTNQALMTIEVLALNRPSLVSARREAAADVKNAITLVTNEGEPDERIQALLAEGQPHLGIRRWAARRALHQAGASRAWFRTLGLEDSLAMRLAVGASLPAIPPPSLASLPVDDLARASLTQVTIRNFRAIKELTLSFAAPQIKSEPWLLLVGNNGVGKSTVLKAIALAMVDEQTRQRLVPDASSCVRRGTGGGSVALRYSDGAEVVLRFRKDSTDFEMAGTPPPLLVLGYGPTRLPPTADHPSLSMAGRVDVENLFDPFAPLSDAEKWLANTEVVPPRQFNLHARDLKALLPVDERDRLIRRAGKLYAHIGDSSTPLPDLSDGFRSVLSMATDMMMQLSSYWESMRTAEGLVLIDEIEVHLHPQWRMGIVPLLRQVFPRLRVIATTHDPLCLQETNSGEVVRLERAEGGEVDAVTLDVPKGLRADQLLTGDWFRLTTTTDHDTASLKEEHSRLLIEPQTSSVRSRRADIEQILRGRANGFQRPRWSGWRSRSWPRWPPPRTSGSPPRPKPNANGWRAWCLTRSASAKPEPMLWLSAPQVDPTFDSRAAPLRQEVSDAMDKALSSPGTPLPKITKALWGSFKKHFAAQQFGRCGYCEVGVIVGQPGDVEHFAPKNAVTQFGVGGVAEEGTETKYVASLKGRKPSEQWAPGYWWLAYDWGNYLLSCRTCNSDWKGTLFPVRQPPPRLRPRTQTDPMEDSLLLNPYGRRDPGRHLRFNLDGSVEPRNNSPYGRETIRTCGLNRLALRDHRQPTCVRAYRAVDQALQQTAAGVSAANNTGLRDLHAMGVASDVAEFPGVVRAIILDRLTPLTWRSLDDLFGSSSQV